MLSKHLRTLWGEFTPEEAKKVGLLAVTFFFLIGVYWAMRPFKDGLFVSLVGPSSLGLAKVLSFGFISLVILFYSKLVDLLQRYKLFYVFPAIYAGLFVSFAYFLTHPTIGLANIEPGAGRIFGWAVYLVTESYGSLMVPLFWGFAASITDSGAAKRHFPIILTCGQIGTILSTTTATYAGTIGLPQFALIIAFGILMVPVLITIFIKKVPGATVEKGIAKKSTGMFEGLRLLFSQPYLVGLLGVASLYEVVNTIIEIQMKTLARPIYPSAEKLTEFMGMYGQAVNIISFLFVLIGTSFLIRRFGLTFCLVLFPVAVAGVICYTWAFPTLWVLFGAAVMNKGLSYALNNPCKDMLYIPTSKDVKFKAKGWIDGFGGRAAKATGSGVTIAMKTTAALLFYGSLISLGVVGIWIIAALYVSMKNKKLVEEGKIIE